MDAKLMTALCFFFTASPVLAEEVLGVRKYVPQLRAGYKARRALDSALAMSRLVGYGSSQKTF